jgi:hypothetical protein
MEINTQGGVRIPQSLSGAKPQAGTDFPVVKKSENVEGTVPVPAADKVDVVSAEQRRFERVKRAAESFFKDTYAVNDHTFTIFKDNTGQYITRFTSLRDGKVTYIPEPKLLQHSSSAEALIEIQV